MFSAMDDGRTHSVQFLEGDSRMVLSKFANAEIQRESAFDLIHIDGGHGWQSVVSDVMQTARLAHPLTVVVIDDCTPSLNCSGALYSCWSENCVCDAVAEM